MDTPFLVASWEGKFEVVPLVLPLLLEHGADVDIPNRRNVTPFQAASERGFSRVSQLLLEYGINSYKIVYSVPLVTHYLTAMVGDLVT